MSTNDRHEPLPNASTRFAPAIYLTFAILLILTNACAKPPRWTSEDNPSPADVAILLKGVTRGDIREPTESEISKIPIREELRPCCAFGTDLKVRLGAVSVPGFRIGNIMEIDQVGPHTYDSGALTRAVQASANKSGSRENNGLLCTCRGGFIDTAHVRDYVDWTLYLAAELARNLSRGMTIEFPEEGRRGVSSPNPSIRT